MPLVTFHSIKLTVARLPVAWHLLVSFAAVLWDVAQRSPPQSHVHLGKVHLI